MVSAIGGLFECTNPVPWQLEQETKGLLGGIGARPSPFVFLNSLIAF